MTNISSLNSGQVRESQNQDSLSIGGGNLLSQLEDRVSQALGKNESLPGGENGLNAEMINPQEVVNYMSQLSQEPMSGENVSFVV